MGTFAFLWKLVNTNFNAVTLKYSLLSYCTKRILSISMKAHSPQHAKCSQ